MLETRQKSRMNIAFQLQEVACLICQVRQWFSIQEKPRENEKMLHKAYKSSKEHSKEYS